MAENGWSAEKIVKYYYPAHSYKSFIEVFYVAKTWMYYGRYL